MHRRSHICRRHDLFQTVPMAKRFRVQLKAQASIPVVDQDAIFQRFYAGPGLLLESQRGPFVIDHAALPCPVNLVNGRHSSHMKPLRNYRELISLHEPAS